MCLFANRLQSPTRKAIWIRTVCLAAAQRFSLKPAGSRWINRTQRYRLSPCSACHPYRCPTVFSTPVPAPCPSPKKETHSRIEPLHLCVWEPTSINSKPGILSKLALSLHCLCQLSWQTRVPLLPCCLGESRVPSRQTIGTHSLNRCQQACSAGTTGTYVVPVILVPPGVTLLT